jgi:hypothetical protein
VGQGTGSCPPAPPARLCPRQRPPPPCSPGSPHLPDTVAPHRVLDVMALIETEPRWSRRLARGCWILPPTLLGGSCQEEIYLLWLIPSPLLCAEERPDPQKNPRRDRRASRRSAQLHSGIAPGSPGSVDPCWIRLRLLPWRQRQRQLRYQRPRQLRRHGCQRQLQLLLFLQVPFHYYPQNSQKCLTARASGGRIYLPTLTRRQGVES